MQSARFCAVCGQSLASTRRTGLYVLVIAVVVGSVVVSATLFLRQPRAAALPATEAAPTTLPNPLPEDVERKVGDLLVGISSLSTSERIQRQRMLVRVYVAAGRFDHAANSQRSIAQQTDVADDWRLAGDYYYGWLRYVQSAGGPVIEIADQAVHAYTNVLAVEPQNLDVRTDLATAYLASSQPVKAVREIKNVLGLDPDHLEARFNYGVMLAEIGKIDEARVQFDRVMSSSEPGSYHFRQAEEAKRIILAE